MPRVFASLKRALRASSLAFTPIALTVAAAAAQPALGQTVRLTEHVPIIAALSQPTDRVAPQETIHLALALPLRNQAGLTDLLERLYTPGDPAYQHFLTPAQFAAEYSPTQQDYDAVAGFASARGLSIEGTHSNRLVLDVSGPASAVESAFALHLNHYQDVTGQVYRAPDANPAIPASLAGTLSAVVGLDDTITFRPHNVRLPETLAPFTVTKRSGTGPNGGLSPSDIRSAYGLNSGSLTGAGQTLAVLELDGYRSTDIAAYEQKFGLASVPLQNILVNGATGRAGSNADEVTLDIELQTAIAPGASKILVYEGTNSSTGILDAYQKIATDNLAKQISTSWGGPELSSSASFRNSENAIFQQMAAQGQSIFSAAGDDGAYDNGRTLSVDDPSSQPYMTAVGGTSLRLSNGVWQGETTWNDGLSGGAGGGGISAVWPIPSYQSGVVSAASKGSTTYRNIPDVSLNADPQVGYAIYVDGSWQVYGGTSCAAPLWAAFTALVNQQRASAGAAPIGFLNPALYTVAKSARYTADFHDIADGSTNLFYPAVGGYDDATGWGSFIGAGLLTDLAAYTTSGTTTGSGGGTTTSPAPPTPTVTQLLGNPGFENGDRSPAPWVVTAGVINSSREEPPHSGSWDAWLDGYRTSHTDTISQTVTIPSSITTATLTFWLHIDTAKAASSKTSDTLAVQVSSSAGAVLKTLATYTNLNAASGYAQKSFDLSAYKGTTITLKLTGVQTGSLPTSFVVDDFALNAE